MITPTDLTTEYALNPISIDTPQPRFGWILESDRRGQSQLAYQVLVGGSAEELQAGRADKWDSGKVTSDRSVNVPYAGGALASDETCCWQVRVWDQDDRASAYSEPAAFTMGLLNESDWTGPLDRRALRRRITPAAQRVRPCQSCQPRPPPISPASGGTISISTAGASATMSSTPATSEYTERVLSTRPTDVTRTASGRRPTPPGVMLGKRLVPVNPAGSTPLRGLSPPCAFS